MGINRDRFKAGTTGDWVDRLTYSPSERAKRREAAVRAAAVAAAHRPTAVAQVSPEKPAEKSRTFMKKAALARVRVAGNTAAQLVTTHKRLSSAVIIIVVAGVGVVTVTGLKRSTDKLESVSSNQGYSYVLPEGREDLRSRMQYDQDKKVATYQDSIGGVSISVNQQPLPDDITSNASGPGLESLANSIGATEVLASANPTAYIKEGAQGRQTVIFAKHDRLYILRSSGSIDTFDWAAYITSL